MSDNNEVESPAERGLDRRLLLRGGAVLGAAAGVAVVGAAMGPTAAHAADGDTALLGKVNEATTTTTLKFGGPSGSPSPALAVTNPGGPVLKLSPVALSYDTDDLKLGELAVTLDGPVIGVFDGVGGAQTTFLATGLDLDQLPISVPISPIRRLDTRSANGRAHIKTTSKNALNSSGQLKAGAWIDVAIENSDFAGLVAVFVNVVAATPTANGFIAVYPPGPRPATSTLNYVSRQTIANSTFILTGIADEDKDWTVVRIFTSATTHVLLDVTGFSLVGIGSQASAAKGTALQRKAVKNNRMARIVPGR